MALAPITWTDTSKSDFHVGHATPTRGTHDSLSLSLAHDSGGTTYTFTDVIDTSGFDVLIFKVITSANGGSGTYYAGVVPFGYDQLGTTAAERLHGIQGVADHTNDTIGSLPTDTALPAGGSMGSGSSYYAHPVGWVDLRTVGKSVVLGCAAGSAGASMKVEIQLIQRRM